MQRGLDLFQKRLVWQKADLPVLFHCDMAALLPFIDDLIWSILQKDERDLDLDPRLIALDHHLMVAHSRADMQQFFHMITAIGSICAARQKQRTVLDLCLLSGKRPGGSFFHRFFIDSHDLHLYHLTLQYT